MSITTTTSGRITHRLRAAASIIAAIAVGAVGAVVGTASPAGAQAGTTAVAITEVASWGSSSNTGYGVDWFEVTNFGATAVDITGWKMDDNSNTFASAVALGGITSIAAGQSVIFMETTDPAKISSFRTLWNAPNVLIGTYTGSGVGLSNNGDAVNLFNASGALVTGVNFGSANTTTTPYRTFENAGGLGATAFPTPTISVLSAVGINGAYASTDNIGIGSPGTNPAGGTGPDPVIPEFPAGGVILAMLVGLGLVALVIRRRQASAA